MNRSLSSFLPSGRAWIFALVIVYILTGVETHRRVGMVERLSRLEGGYSLPRVEDSSSPTGYALGVRHTLGTDRNDDLHWVVNVQEARKKEVLRLREVDYDNAPEGRKAHWSSVYSWWIRIVATGLEFSGMDGGPSVEIAALCANLLLALLAATILAVVVARRWGSLSASVTCLGFAAAIPFRDVYKYGMGDHHAAAILSSLLCVVFLAIAIEAIRSRADTDPKVRRWITLSALFGAIGMWINVVSAVPILASMVVAGACVSYIDKRAGESTFRSRMSLLWRDWSLLGAGFCVVAWIIEYAPGHLGLRLEVNHPLYALAWCGAGMVLWSVNDTQVGKGKRRLSLVLSAMAILQLPAVILLFRESVFQVADPFLLAVHERYIMEFQSLLDNLAVLPSTLRSASMLIPYLVLPLGIVALWKLRGNRALFASLLTLALPSCILFLATLLQARWWSHSAAMLIPLAAFLCSKTVSSHLRKRYWAFIVACFIPGLLIFVAGAFADVNPTRREELRAVEKSLAHYIRARGGDEDLIVLASPDATTNFIYYGGIRGIGTFYWENNRGLQRAAKIFSTTDLNEAKRLIDAARISHIVILSWGGFEREYVQLYRDFVEEEGKPSGQSFLMSLVEDQRIPSWLRPIPFRVAGSREDVALVFEVVDEMSPGQAASSKFEYMLEMGWQQAAFSMQAVLQRYGEEPAAAISLARLAALSGQKPLFSRQVDWLVEQLEQGDLALRLPDRARLAGVLAIGGERELARGQLEKLVSGLSEASLRDFNGEELMHLLDLARAFETPGFDSGFQALAESLLPTHLKTRWEVR